MNFKTMQVEIYEKLTPFELNPLLSKSRVRIFYKYLNRNHTFITDEVAKMLEDSLPYTVVSGIYDPETEDYTDHGDKRSEGRAYGIVPQNPNAAYELHTDSDGIEREYLCADVVLFTERYEEAKKIVGKPQSMELYPKTLKGKWVFDKNTKKQYYEFTEARFMGLQVLGSDVEPCFEGAEFFSLNDVKGLEKIIDQVQNYIQQSQGGKDEMVLNFKLSDDDKRCQINKLLNNTVDENGNQEYNYWINKVYDDYAIVEDYKKCKTYRQYYEKNDEENTVILGDQVEVEIMDISAAEKAALEALRKINGGSFEKIEETFTEKDSKIEELNGTITTLNTEKETFAASVETKDKMIGELNSKITTLDESVNTLTASLETTKEEADAAKGKLEQYELSELNIQKDQVIDRYSNLLDKEVITEYTSKKAEYTVAELEKSLAAEYVNKNQSAIFEKQEPSQKKFPKQNDGANTLDPVAKLILKHRNNK